MCKASYTSLSSSSRPHTHLQRYDEGSSALEEGQEETGWKLVHGDVFRPPPLAGALSVMIGTGVQVHIYVDVCMYVCMYVCMHVYMYYTYVYMYICTYILVCVRVY
jgi:hypothetical protein